MKIKELNIEQIRTICINFPDYIYNIDKSFLLNYNLEWLCVKDPEYCINYGYMGEVTISNTKWISENRFEDGVFFNVRLMCKKYPEKVFDYDPENLYDFYPEYLINNHPSWLDDNHPDWKIFFDMEGYYRNLKGSSPKTFIQYQCFKNPEWCYLNHYDKMELFNLIWLCKNKPETTFNDKPELVFKYNPEWVKQNELNWYKRYRPLFNCSNDEEIPNDILNVISWQFK